MDRVEYRTLGQRAGVLVKNEIKYGRIPKLDGTIKCVDCGEIATCYDHRNYYKPLDVEPVCKSCNNLRGPAIPIPNDHYKNNGYRWNSLDEGFEDGANFSGHCTVFISDNLFKDPLFGDLTSFLYEYRGIDQDVKIAMNELNTIRKRYETA